MRDDLALSADSYRVGIFIGGRVKSVEAAWQEVQKKIPGVMLRVRSVTTSSLYAKTPDGYSLRIGDHKGIEKWSYKWNLRLDMGEGEWVTEHKNGKHIARFYTGSVDELAQEINASYDAKRDVAKELCTAQLKLKIAVAALEEIEMGCDLPDRMAVSALQAISGTK
jgi:hypothetical protein